MFIVFIEDHTVTVKCRTAIKVLFLNLCLYIKKNVRENQIKNGHPETLVTLGIEEKKMKTNKAKNTKLK